MNGQLGLGQRILRLIGVLLWSSLFVVLLSSQRFLLALFQLFMQNVRGLILIHKRSLLLKP